MSRELSVGSVGCGRWGRLILRDLLKLRCDVPIVSRSDESRRNAVKGGVTLVVDRLNALPAVAGVVVASPTNTHATVIEALLERNVLIFTEKPLAPDRASAERLAQIAPNRLFVMNK